ncbi:MAG: hypothetical protein UIM53_07590 [Acutalibacteraceae bacterium]|nr:hypothetical protein [Acutalibacteraceae bacterium]
MSGEDDFNVSLLSDFETVTPSVVLKSNFERILFSSVKVIS